MDKIPIPAASDLSSPALGGSDLDHPAYRHLLARQKAPNVSELTLGLLHKYNNLFTGVMFLMEESVAQAAAGEPVGDRLQEICNTLRHAHTFVDRIVQLHIDEEEDDAGYHELDVVIADQLDLARLLLPRGTALTHEPAGERLTFYASQRALCEILLHVVGNCGEAIPKRGGAVTISSRIDMRDESSVSVEIRDNGPGFTAEALRQMFVPFCTTKDESRHPGLGLLRCRELAQAFGGDLTARNHPDGGAVVILTLPRDNSQPLS